MVLFESRICVIGGRHTSLFIGQSIVLFGYVRVLFILLEI